MKKLVSLTLLTLAVASCSGPRADGSYRRSDIGALTGAVVGGVVGSAFGKGSGQNWAIAAGALYGASAGDQYGAALDRMQLQNRTRHSNGVFEYLPDNTYKAWVDPNTGRTETVRPIQTMPSENGTANCRVFETTRGAYSAIGMVCRDAYGRWRIVD
jgi:surface antigen